MIALLLAFALAADPAPPSDFEVDRQVAWARLYGVLRWFHPADELAEVSPEALACLGAQRAAGADDPESLAAALSELVAPLAPTVRIWVDGEDAPPTAEVEAGEGRTPIAWMHRGVGLSSPGLYSSVRSDRAREVPASGPSFGNVSQSLPATDLAGLPFRLNGRLRAFEGQIQLWLRTDGGEDRFFDNTDDRPVRDSEWQEVDIEGVIPAGTEHVVFGAFVPGIGHGVIESIFLSVERDGAWQEVTENPGFDDGTKGWKAQTPGYDITERAGVVTVRKRTATVSPAFVDVPDPETVTELDLGAGIRATVPLVLFSEDGRTLPHGDGAALDEALAAVPCSDPEDLETRLAAVAIAWNVHQHFHPYLDVVDTDWMAELPRAVRGAHEATDAASFREVLERMTSELDDGHVVVRGGPAPIGRLALFLDVVEGQIVVRDSGVDGVNPGDVVLAVNGVDARVLHASWVPLVSGSPQNVLLRAMGALTTGEKGETATLELRAPDGTVREVQAEYGSYWTPIPEHPAVRTLDDGVMVVDLTRADWNTLRKERKALAKAPGVVFDLRGYPTDAGSKLLPWLITEPVDTDWMFVADRTRPDRAEPVTWNGFAWDLKPAGPHIDNTAWITDARAISYSESVLGHVKDLGIGPIVGEPTAGANGNINPYVVPGGYTISWTGMKVLNRDGSQHHVIGITPTHPLEPTVAGLAAGRDEQLEKALELVR